MPDEHVGMDLHLLLCSILCAQPMGETHAPRAHHVLSFTFSFMKFQDLSGWQGRGGLRGKHTTTPPLYLPANCMVVVAAHTAYQGELLVDGERRRTHSLARSNSKEQGKHPQARNEWNGTHSFRPVCILNHCPTGCPIP